MQFEKVSYEMYAPRCYALDKQKAWDDIVLPQRSTPSSAGYDFYAPEDITISAHGKTVLATGVKAKMDDGWFLMCVPRSSIGIKKGIGLANTVGVIDADYYNNPLDEGQIFACLENKTGKNVTISKGERFMQGIFLIYGKTVDDIPLTDQRAGGIGSTGR